MSEDVFDITRFPNGEIVRCNELNRRLIFRAEATMIKLPEHT
jgi:hypothetical protein